MDRFKDLQVILTALVEEKNTASFQAVFSYPEMDSFFENLGIEKLGT